MRAIIIYDDKGTIFLQSNGDGPIPKGGIQYLETEIPSGKIATKVDTSITPHKPVLEDIPKTEIEVAQERIQALEDYILEKETSNITDGL